MNLKYNSVELARELIGYRITNGETSGIIVETEAYPGEKDPACHYSGKSTKRGKIFEKGPGTIYIFSMHGYHCMNFICGSKDYPEGVLIRAVEPVEGIDKMKERRGKETSLTDGPGKLTEALNIRKEALNGKKFKKTSLKLEKEHNPEIVADTRIGISSAEHWPLRFCHKNSNHLSKPIEQSFNPEEAYTCLEENIRY